MDYSLLKQIEQPPYYLFPKQRFLSLPSNPHVDYINPGLGFATKVYDFYIPRYERKLQHSISKTDCNDSFPIERTTKASSSNDHQNQNQVGKGDDLNGLNLSTTNNPVEVYNADADKTTSTLGNINKNLQKRLSSTVFDSFMHPKIKTAKISFDSKSSSLPEKRSKKSLNHKFNVI